MYRGHNGVNLISKTQTLLFMRRSWGRYLLRCKIRVKGFTDMSVIKVPLLV